MTLLVVTRDMPPCSFCRQAKLLLQRRSMDFEEVPLEKARELVTIRSVPQVFLDVISEETRIGGFEALSAWIESKEKEDNVERNGSHSA